MFCLQELLRQHQDSVMEAWKVPVMQSVATVSGEVAASSDVARRLSGQLDALSVKSTAYDQTLTTFEAKVLDVEKAASDYAAGMQASLVERQQESAVAHSQLTITLEVQAGEIHTLSLQNENLRKDLEKEHKKAEKAQTKVQKQTEMLAEMDRRQKELEAELVELRKTFEAIRK